MNGNYTRDAWEPWGLYSESSTLVTGDTAGIDIPLDDVPSNWGGGYRLHWWADG